MLFDPSTASHLKPWLIRTLEPICDAEPGALADYIHALLKHNASEAEMRKELETQLEEFLENECAGFLDSLFSVLRTKSYLPYSATASTGVMDTGIPIPLDGLLSSSIPTSPGRGRKRSLGPDDRDGGRPMAKGPRLSNDGEFSRYSNGRGGMGNGNWRGRGGGHMNGFRDGPMGGAGMGGMQFNGRGPYQPPDQRRGICRDYFNNGYCARGAYCKFSHGDDAIVPASMFPPNQAFAFGNGGGIPFGGGGAYDPNEARMDMRGRNRPPTMPRAHHEEGGNGMQGSGELPVIQDLTPASAETENRDSAAQPIPSHPPIDGNSRNSAIPNYFMGSPPGGMGMDVEMSGPQYNFQPMGQYNNNRRGGVPNGPRGGPRHQSGTFGGEVHNFRPERRSDKTLVVEKIPEDKLTLEEVNNWFKRFGTVTNVAIDNRSAKALVSFADNNEARAAWKSEDAVFNNRFVKVFWHRPLEGHGQAGAKALAASAPLVANIAAKEAEPSSSIPSTTRKPSAVTSTSSLLAAKQQLLEQQIAEQKKLMGSLATASADEKKDIMARLRKLGEEMKPSSSPSVPGASKSPAPSTAQELKERERLDKELDMHAASVPDEGESGAETSEDLKAKLDKLKAEAASLGIVDEPTHSTSTYRGYRGRGRGSRSYYRGAARGGRPGGSMKLDNRPKQLLIQGASAESVQSIKDWYESTGQLESVDTTPEGDIVASFRTRAAAEQGYAKGGHIPTVDSAKISWHTNQPSLSVSKSNSMSTDRADYTADDGSRLVRDSEADIDDREHEEVVVSGWGGDGEDSLM